MSKPKCQSWHIGYTCCLPKGHKGIHVAIVGGRYIPWGVKKRWAVTLKA